MVMIVFVMIVVVVCVMCVDVDAVIFFFVSTVVVAAMTKTCCSFAIVLFRRWRRIGGCTISSGVPGISSSLSFIGVEEGAAGVSRITISDGTDGTGRRLDHRILCDWHILSVQITTDEPVNTHTGFSIYGNDKRNKNKIVLVFWTI